MTRISGDVLCALLMCVEFITSNHKHNGVNIMTNAQKTTVWFAALDAVKFESFPIKCRIATEVAKSLGLKAFFSGNGFGLYTMRGTNPTKQIANAPIVA